MRPINDPVPAGEASLDVLFDLAQKKAAEIPDLESYAQWMTRMERRFDVMPSWWWRESERKRAYVENIATKLKWLDDQAGVNAGNREMLSSIFARFGGR